MSIVGNIVKWILLFSAAALVQAAVAPKIAIMGISPNFVVLLFFIFSIEHGKTAGIWVGFLMGLFIDVYSAGILGANALAKTVVGGIVGFFDKKNFMISLVFQLVLLVVVLIVNDLIVYLPNMQKTGEPITEIHKYLLNFSVPRAIYTVFLATLFFIVREFFSTKWRT